MQVGLHVVDHVVMQLCMLCMKIWTPCIYVRIYACNVLLCVALHCCGLRVMITKGMQARWHYSIVHDGISVI